MRKWIAAVLSGLLAFGMAAMLGGCSAQTQVQSEQELRCAEYMNELLIAGEGMACDKTASYNEKDYSTYFEYWYDMPMSFVSDGAICYVESGDNVDEISILRPLSNVTYDTVKKALEGRVERQKEHFGGLIDEQAERMDGAVLCESGGYLLFVVSDDPQPVIDRFEELTAAE